MKNANVYTDKLYEKNNKLYTEKYIINNCKNIDSYTPCDIDNFSLKEKTVVCTYDQIFYPDSSLILCNEISNVFPEIYDYIENGNTYDEADDYYYEIYQFYIIDEGTANRLIEHTNEIVFYCEKLDLYILGVTHFGTSWEYVSAEFTL